MANKYDVVHNERKFWLNFRRTVAYIVLTLMCILCLFFFYIMLINCTRSHLEIQKSGFAILPSDQFITNLTAILNDPNIPMWRGLINSLIVSIGCVFCSVYFSAMTAYGCHVYDFKGRKFAFNFILLIMTIPTQVTALGFVDMMRNWKLTDNLLPLIVPAIAAPTVFFFMKQYMDSSLPLDIVEAARIDGANEFRTFNSIILPILKPAMAVQAIFTFVSSWNNYFTRNLLITKSNMKTLPIMVYMWRCKDFASISMGHIYMVITVSILPVMIIYFCLSKFIVGGVTLGAVKG
ncbi:MAG: carbohydrate ABC transporter permease [Oscillospiraceae bacterium]|nr:carbohydrate ABC transporter permease [Oscillospiraceae bacterium]